MGITTEIAKAVEAFATMAVLGPRQAIFVEVGYSAVKALEVENHGELPEALGGARLVKTEDFLGWDVVRRKI